MKYNYQENTLLHSVGFNLQRLESILTYGIISPNKAKTLDVNYSKNYFMKHQNQDYISCSKVQEKYLVDPDGAFVVHSKKGINLIIENIDYIENNEEACIHRNGEVLVKDFIPLENITGIAIDQNFNNILFRYVPIIPTNVTKYPYIEQITLNYLEYLNSLNATYDRKLITLCLRELLLINNAIFSIKDVYNSVDDLYELYEDYDEVIRELNYILAFATEEAFKRNMKTNGTIAGILSCVINNRLQIYDIPFNETQVISFEIGTGVRKN